MGWVGFESVQFVLGSKLMNPYLIVVQIDNFMIYGDIEILEY